MNKLNEGDWRNYKGMIKIFNINAHQYLYIHKLYFSTDTLGKYNKGTIFIFISVFLNLNHAHLIVFVYSEKRVAKKTKFLPTL